MKRIVSFVLSFALVAVLFLGFASPVQASGSTPRIAGDDRVATAIAVSKSVFSNSQTAILVNGWVAADSNSAANLAKKENAPILLNGNAALDSRNTQEMSRLGVKKVFIVGGVTMVSTQAENTLRSKGYSVVRIAGDDRYLTNQLVNDYVFGQSTKTTDQVIIANGYSDMDALIAAAYAYSSNTPIILSNPSGSVAIEALKSHQYRQAVIIGNNSALGTALDKLPSAIRISGADQYEMSWKAHRQLFGTGAKAIVTTGETFADALAGISLAKNGSSIVLAKDSIFDLPDDIYLNRSIMLGGRVKSEDGYPWLANLTDGDTVAIYVNPHQDDEVLSMGVPLIQDKNTGKQILLMQMTRGEKSSAINAVNRLLTQEGKTAISINEFADARTHETKDVLNRLGFNDHHVIEYPYSNLELTRAQVTNELVKLMKTMKGKKVELRTLANLSADISQGGIDHKACADGVRDFQAEYAPQITANYYASPDNPVSSNFDKLHPSVAETSQWFGLFDAFYIWDPNTSRYSIGKLSVNGLFDQVKSAGYVYIQR